MMKYTFSLFMYCQVLNWTTLLLFRKRVIKYIRLIYLECRIRTLSPVFRLHTKLIVGGMVVLRSSINPKTRPILPDPVNIIILILFISTDLHLLEVTGRLLVIRWKRVCEEERFISKGLSQHGCIIK